MEGQIQADRPFMFVVADGAASSKGGVGWCYWLDGKYYESGWIAQRQMTNIIELLAIYEALLNTPYGAEVLLWTDSKFAVEVITGRLIVSGPEGQPLLSELPRPISNPDIKRLRYMILMMMEVLDAHVTVEMVKSATNEVHNYVDRRARAQAQLANIRAGRK